jgi:hypothetical protein
MLGLHASISIHLCADYFDAKTGEWGMNLDCFIEKVGNHPERIENLYFLFILVTRSISKLTPMLEIQPFCSATETELITDHVNEVSQVLATCPSTFDETLLFADTNNIANNLKTKITIRDAFRNISRIMDCVACQKCRLWGKLQTTGLGTALKVLFGDIKAERLTRMELVSLINAYARFSESIRYLGEFHKLMQKSKGIKTKASNVNQEIMKEPQLNFGTDSVVLVAAYSGLVLFVFWGFFMILQKGGFSSFHTKIE